MDAGDIRVGDDLDGAGAGNELLEQLEGADPHVDPGGREHDSLGIVRVGVRGLLVDRQPREVEGTKRLLVDRQRPPPLAGPPPRELRVDLEQHRERAARKGLPRHGRQDGAAAESDHGGLGGSEDGCGDHFLDCPEPGLTVAREQLLDRGARLPLDLVVEIDERAVQPAGHLLAERRLSRAHEAGEREVPA